MIHCLPKLNLRALATGLCAASSMFVAAACNDTVSEPDLENMGVATLQQQLGGLFGFRPLSQEPIPAPTGGHILDQAAAVRLGKAFFWDIQAGSDGQLACAGCHFDGGADSRRFNTINPGFDN